MTRSVLPAIIIHHIRMMNLINDFALPLYRHDCDQGEGDDRPQTEKCRQTLMLGGRRLGAMRRLLRCLLAIVIIAATDAVREDWTPRRSDCTTRGARLRFYYDVPS